ncbi:MAG: type III-B CRISPR module RAMP protein Cmr4 [Snowella sp.]|nr:type III-B CRISPR module RAMP protein Cmr4 [Snowella sp.]
MKVQHLYLLSPLHTGGTTQEGNLLGIARESHTNFPYIPSSTIRGKLRSSVQDEALKFQLFGTELGNAATNLEQGAIWIGDGSLLWIPIPSLSHGVIWVSCPLLLNRYIRLKGITPKPQIEANLCSFHQPNGQIYLKDAIFKGSELKNWPKQDDLLPNPETTGIDRVLVLSDQHCATVIQMGLWRQVKIKLDEHKTVDGGFRYEEAIPPDSLMYFTWGITSQTDKSKEDKTKSDFQKLLTEYSTLQIGGQESLGRGFVESFT